MFTMQGMDRNNLQTSAFQRVFGQPPSNLIREPIHPTVDVVLFCHHQIC
jgi:hypothetical protein